MTDIHLGRAPDKYDYRDQNIMRRSIERALLNTTNNTSSNMGDIVVTDPTNGEVLIYSDGSWINHAMVLDDLDDVVSPSPTSGHYLYYNGSNWVDRQVVTDDIEVNYDRVSAHTLTQLIDEQCSPGYDNGGVMSISGAYTWEIAAGGGYFTDSDTVPNDLYYVEWPAYTGQSALANATSWVGMKWDGPGTDPYPVIRSSNEWNYLNEWPMGNITAAVGGLITGLSNTPFRIRTGVANLSQRIIETETYRRAFNTGLIMGEKDDGAGNYRYVTMTEGDLWAHQNRVFCRAVDTLTDASQYWLFFGYYHDGVGQVASVAQRIWAASSDFDGGVTPTQDQWLWNDTTDSVNPLKQMTVNRWGVFWFIISSQGFPIGGFHDAQYNTEAQAEEAAFPTHFQQFSAQLIAKYVFQQGSDTAQHIFILWGEAGISSAEVNVHGDLAGLHEDDHSQYLHLNISREVTAQHTFSVYGTGDWLAGEWDLLIGDTVTNDGGAINVGGAAYSLAGNMGSIGTPGITLDGSVISSNRGGGPDGNIEFGWTDSTDEIRFALAISGAGYGTYNPRSMIIAGPAVADDDIVTGSYWGFDNLPMDTGTYGADCGVQHDLEVLGKIWVDNIGSSTQPGTVTFDDDVVFTASHTVSGTDNVYMKVQATGVDSMAWFALQNDAREYRLRVTGANEFDIYDVTAATTRFWIDTSGFVYTTALRIAGYQISPQVDTWEFSLAGAPACGGNIVLYGGSHLSWAYDIALRVVGTEKLTYDDSASLWTFATDVDMQALTATTARIGSATPGDDYEILRLVSSRSWQFETYGVDGVSQALMLRDLNGSKDFHVGDVAGDPVFTVNTGGTITANVSSTGFTIYRATGTANLRITAEDNNANIFLWSGLDDVGEESQIYLKGGSLDTIFWQIGKDSGDDFRIYDNVAVQNAFKIVSNGDMTLSPAGGTTNVTGALMVSGRVYCESTDDVDLIGVSGGLIVGSDGSGAHLAFDANEIMAKASATTTATLYLNAEGGNVNFGSSAVGLAWNTGAARFAPQTSGAADLGSSGTQWGEGWFSGAVTIGGATSILYLDLGTNTVTSQYDISIAGQGFICTQSNMFLGIDSDNDGTGNYFSWGHNSNDTTGFDELMRLSDGHTLTLGTTTSTGQSTIYIESYNDNAIIYMRSGHDGNLEQSEIIFSGGTTNYFQIGKDASNQFRIYDHGLGGNALSLAYGGAMVLTPATSLTLNPANGNVYVGSSVSGGTRSFWIRSYTADAAIYLESGHDGTEELSGIFFRNASANAFGFYKESNGTFYMRDYTGARSFITQVPNGDLTLDPIGDIIAGESITFNNVAHQLSFANDPANYYMKQTSGSYFTIDMYYGTQITKGSTHYPCITMEASNATAGHRYIGGYYGGGNSFIPTWGSMYSSAGALMGYGLWSSQTTANSFISSTASTVERAVLYHDGAQLKYSVAASQSVSVGSAVTVTPVFTASDDEFRVYGRIIAGSGSGNTNEISFGDGDATLSAGSNTIGEVGGSLYLTTRSNMYFSADNDGSSGTFYWRRTSSSTVIMSLTSGDTLAVGVNSSRPITIDGGEGSLKFKGGTGGWTVGSRIYGSGDTHLGDFAGYGSGDTLTYMFIGIYSTGEIARFYADGAAASGGSTMYLGMADSSYGDLRLMGTKTGSSAGGRLLCYTAADYDTNVNYYTVRALGEDFHIQKESTSLMWFDQSLHAWYVGSYTWANDMYLRLVVDSGHDAIFMMGEESANYGFSWRYNGDGDNDLYLYAHDNDAAGDQVLVIDRTNEKVTFSGQIGSAQSDEGNSNVTTLTIDWNNGNSITVTNNGTPTNRIVFSNGVAGFVYVLRVLNTTGATNWSTSAKWPTNVEFPSDNYPTMTTTVGDKSVFTFYYDGTDYLAIGNVDYS